MNHPTQIESAPATTWQKFHRWIRALDEALDFDPTEQLRTSVHHLNEKVRQLEAAVCCLEASPNSQSEGGK